MMKFLVAISLCVLWSAHAHLDCKVSCECGHGHHYHHDHQHHGHHHLGEADADWWFPYGHRPGAPSYLFGYPSTPVGSGGSWYDADIFCRTFGGFSNLLWIADQKEFALVQKWVTSKFSPASDNLRVWTGGQKTFAVPNWIYRWNYTSDAIEQAFWAPGQPNDLMCVGMNPVKQNYLQGYNCREVATSTLQPQYSGFVCKRQVVAPPKKDVTM